MKVFYDTEDDSKDLLAKGVKAALGKKPEQQNAIVNSYLKQKQVTELAALTETGDSFFARGKSASGKFLQWLGKFEDCRAYALNQQYDLGALFGNSLDAIDVTLVGGRMIKARWRNVVFLDVFNIWPMSVAKLGDAFGLKKKKLDVHSKEYVFRDVEIIRAAILYAEQFVRRYGVESLTSTLGGLCVKLWQAMDGENWHDSSEFNRESLFGGRVELFGTGGNFPCVYTDINSLYPSMMLEKFPVCSAPMKGIEGYGSAKVQIKIPDCFVAPLPVRRGDGSIFYPVGNVTGVWTQAEIRHAVSVGAKVLKVFEAWGSKDGERFYDRFVKQFYKLRLASKSPAESLMLKLLMNNLYGQLAVSGEITRSMKITEQDYFMQSLTGTPLAQSYGTKKLCNHKIPLPDHVNYLHAAHVTGYGRIRLQEYLAKIPQKDLVYCDTDSIIFFERDQLPFPISTELGRMKLEARADACETYAPKSYKFGKEVKAKGVRKALAKEFIENGEVTYEQPYKFREAVTMYDVGNKKKLANWHRVTKTFKTVYDKKRLENNQYFPLRYSRETALLDVT